MVSSSEVPLGPFDERRGPCKAACEARDLSFPSGGDEAADVTSLAESDLSASSSLKVGDESALLGDCADVVAAEAEELFESGRTDVLHSGQSSETCNHSFKQSAW